MDFQLPELGEGIYEAELVRWLVKPGDAVKRSQPLLEALTDKATMEVPAPFAGTVTKLLAQPGDKVKVGQVVLAYTPTNEPAAVQSVPAAPVTNGPVATPVPVSLTSPADTPVKAAPSVRQMARKLGIDLSRLHGTGPAGRILLDDLTSEIARRQTIADGRHPKPDTRQPIADLGRPGTKIKLAGLRRRIAEHMSLSKRTIPHYSYIDECDVTELVRVREGLKEAYTRRGVRLTYLAFFVKAAVAALREVPIVNASLDESAEEIVLHARYDIGIAVSTPAGLIVPVIREADKKDLGQIAREIERMTSDARTGKQKLEDLRGSTFTITSVGNLGGLISTPVINHPEVGIMGVGKIVKRPVYDEHGNIRPADMVYLSWSFDHRVVDGAVGAIFGNAVIRHLKNPLPLLLPGSPGSAEAPPARADA